MSSNRQHEEDEGEDKPDVARKHPPSEKKRPSKKKITGTSATTQLISNVTTRQATSGSGSGSSHNDNATKDATKSPNKPERSTSTDKSLIPPNRFARASSLAYNNNKRISANNTGLSTEKSSNAQSTKEARKLEKSVTHRHGNQQDDDDADLILPSRRQDAKSGCTSMDQSVTSMDSLALERERVVAQTVFANNDDSDNNLAVDKSLKASLRQEQQDAAALHAGKSASAASYVQANPQRIRDGSSLDLVDGDDVENPLPRTPVTARQSATVSIQTTKPGAYQGNPGEGFRRNASICKDTFLATATSSGQASQPLFNDALSSTTDDTEDRKLPASLFANQASNTNDNTNDQLVQAKPVMDDEESCLPTSVAKSAQLYDKERQRRQLQWWVGASLVLAMLMVLGLLVGVIVRSQRDESPVKLVYVRTPDAAQTGIPTMAPTEFVVGLPETTIQTILVDTGSPQAQAYEWLQNDPYLMDYSESRKVQRFALAALFVATNTAYPEIRSWTNASNWLNYEIHECQWYSSPYSEDNAGLKCDTENRYVDLHLKENQLNGTLPPEVSLLTSLTRINLSHNQLKGVPSEIGMISSLESFQIENNTLTSLPSEFGMLTLLKQLHISDNTISGNVPSEIGLLTSLVELHIQRTSISGQLPTELGNLGQLHDLWAWNTKLTGTLPTEIGKMSGLTTIAMHNGVLEGLIPTELGLLENLEHLQLDAHNLAGSIPTELSQLRSIQFLSFGGNQLTSTIPTELALLSNTLRALRFYQNLLTARIPSELGRLSSLQRLELDGNNLSQNIPTELGQASRLVHLFLASNQLTGLLPTELASLPLLEHLTLNYNSHLEGPIPEEWEDLASGKIAEIFLTGVDITGVIPSGLCNIERLQVDCDADICGCGCGICQ